MSKRTMIHQLRPSVLRTRGAVVAAGMGAVMVVGAGAGVASADAGKAAQPAVVDAAAAVAAQADAQATAAKAKAAKKTAKKKPAKKAPAWVKPVTKYTLTASFAQGGAMWSAKHSGQDFAVPIGTQVKAAGAGVVVKAGPNGGGDGPAYGNAIVIKHNNGKYSQYAHLSKINVNVGAKVKTGQNIAKSGNTGNSSGPHLHFEIRTTPNYGSALNPMAFLRSAGVNL
ncbi:M23 family metallopeptidase [Streptomyces pristinaespiralis]|jgi:murein DD-endopeptidase MepM/ murein hydrolase activator NlpD|uniref:Peptidase n=1 Tax=Streptomyces pristinaespiralis TaxID=38300 RepID=A0A0M4DFW8_STRPR|nr:M23 family metallopeptidase [Streptomyces pristinaespiralis]ALC21697.1 peptidase [Streptomyces pristinaespiralis]QMU15607.1 M23 family metallopeptidase [Streptomyces pristinaespiralis]